MANLTITPTFPYPGDISVDGVISYDPSPSQNMVVPAGYVAIVLDGFTINSGLSLTIGSSGIFRIIT